LVLCIRPALRTTVIHALVIQKRFSLRPTIAFDHQDSLADHQPAAPNQDSRRNMFNLSLNSGNEFNKMGIHSFSGFRVYRKSQRQQCYICLDAIARPFTRKGLISFSRASTVRQQPNAGCSALGVVRPCLSTPWHRWLSLRAPHTHTTHTHTNTWISARRHTHTHLDARTLT
jgi:hypothetical protein